MENETLIVELQSFEKMLSITDDKLESIHDSITFMTNRINDIYRMLDEQQHSREEEKRISERDEAAVDETLDIFREKINARLDCRKVKDFIFHRNRLCDETDSCKFCPRQDPYAQPF